MEWDPKAVLGAEEQEVHQEDLPVVLAAIILTIHKGRILFNKEVLLVCL